MGLALESKRKMSLTGGRGGGGRDVRGGKRNKEIEGVPTAGKSGESGAMPAWVSEGEHAGADRCLRQSLPF